MTNQRTGLRWDSPPLDRAGPADADQTDHPLPGRRPRPGRQGRQLPQPARRRRSGRGRPPLRGRRGRRTGLSRHLAPATRAAAILLDMVRRVAEEIFMPFTVGGGIRTLDDATRLIQAGAEKVSINSAAVKTPELIAAGRRQVRPLRHGRQHRPAPRACKDGPRSLGGPHQRRPGADRAGSGRLGAARRGARRRRDRADLDGRRRHQGRLRPADDPGRVPRR